MTNQSVPLRHSLWVSPDYKRIVWTIAHNSPFSPGDTVPNWMKLSGVNVVNCVGANVAMKNKANPSRTNSDAKQIPAENLKISCEIENRLEHVSIELRSNLKVSDGDNLILREHPTQFCKRFSLSSSFDNCSRDCTNTLYGRSYGGGNVPVHVYVVCREGFGNPRGCKYQAAEAANAFGEKAAQVGAETVKIIENPAVFTTTVGQPALYYDLKTDHSVLIARYASSNGQTAAGLSEGLACVPWEWREQYEKDLTTARN